jgi:hypothetical protein
MDYKKIYDNFMQDRLNKKPERLLLKKTGTYFEGHHIIPKSRGGSGNSYRPKNNLNIVLLTSREHFLAHWILWKIYRDRSSALAFHKMLSSNKNQNRITSSRGYEEAREVFRLTNLGNQYGKGQNRVISEEQKKKQSDFMKGRYVGDLNPSKKPDVRKKISDKLKGKKKSVSHIEKIKIRMSNKQKVICPFCNKELDELNAKKWHFEKCSLNTEQTLRPTTNFVKNNTYGCKKIQSLETEVIYNSIMEASEYFKVSTATISRWVKKNHKVTLVK